MNENEDTNGAQEAEMLAEAGIPQIREILDMSLDLNKDEKLRATALMMAVSYHKETIVKDGAMYQTMKANGTNLRASQPIQVIDAALVFEGYLRGHYNEFVTHMVLNVQHALEDALEGYTPTPDSDGGAE